MVHVVSCRFTRLSCSEDHHPLFRRHYTRSNRERGIKILRCFPHCCPEHVQRCYCGCSVHVLVTFEAEVPTVGNENLVVCARFEPTGATANDGDDTTNSINDERRFRPGEVVPLPSSLFFASSLIEEQKAWIRAENEGESKQKTLPKNAVLYVLNNHKFPKWLYSYDSSVTQTQRDMTHHLVVYIFQLTNTSSRAGEVDAAVLAWHESPAFSLMSYRRSGFSGGDAGCELPALDFQRGNTFAAANLTQIGVDPLGPAHPKTQQPHYGSVNEIQSRRIQLEQKSTHVEPRCDEKPAVDASWWQKCPRSHTRGFREKAQHLLILWRFIQDASVGDVGLCGESVHERIHSHWLHVAAALRAPFNCSEQVANVVDSFLSEHFQAFPRSSERITRDRAVIREAAQLLLHALSSPTLQCLVRSAYTVRRSAISEAQLQDQFVHLIAGLYDALNDETLVPALVDDVLSLVYTQSRYGALRPVMSALMMDSEAQGSLTNAVNETFDLFLTQTQQVITACGAPRPPTIRQHAFAGSKNVLLDSWNHRWLLDPGSVQIADLKSDTTRDILQDMHFAAVARFVCEFGCVDVCIGDDSSSLLLRSALWCARETRGPPMALVLDGRLRRLLMMPSGLSSMIPTAGAWRIGYYTAEFSGGETSVSIDFFGWAEENSSLGGGLDAVPLRRTNLSISIEEEVTDAARNKDLFAFVHGVVYEAWTSELPSVDFGARWSEAKWTPAWEMQAGYLALS